MLKPIPPPVPEQLKALQTNMPLMLRAENCTEYSLRQMRLNFDQFVREKIIQLGQGVDGFLEIRTRTLCSVF